MSVPQRYGITFPFDGMPAARAARARARARRPRLHRPVVGRVGRLRRVHPARGRRAVGARAAARHRDRARVHARRAHARVDGRVDVPGRARAVRARHRHVVQRDRRAVERHAVRQAVPAGARHDPVPPRRARRREGHRGVRDVRGPRVPARHHRARAAADPRRRAARGDAAARRTRGRRRDHQLAVGRRREDGRAARRRRARRSWRASSCSRPTTPASSTRSASARSRRTSPCRSTPRSTSGSAAATSSPTCGACGRKATARRRPTSIPDAVVDELLVWGSPEQCREHIQRYIDNGVTTPAPALFCGPDELPAVVRGAQALKRSAPELPGQVCDRSASR